MTPQDRPQRPQVRAKTGKIAARSPLEAPCYRFPTPQDRPKKAQEPSRAAKTTPRGVKSDSRALKSDSGEARNSKIVVFPEVFQRFLKMRFLQPRPLENRFWCPKVPPRAPKSPPRAAKTVPRPALDRPKSAPDQPRPPQDEPRQAKRSQERPR